MNRRIGRWGRVCLGNRRIGRWDRVFRVIPRMAPACRRRASKGHLASRRKATQVRPVNWALHPMDWRARKRRTVAVGCSKAVDTVA